MNLSNVACIKTTALSLCSHMNFFINKFSSRPRLRENLSCDNYFKLGPSTIQTYNEFYWEEVFNVKWISFCYALNCTWATHHKLPLVVSELKSILSKLQEDKWTKFSSKSLMKFVSIFSFVRKHLSVPMGIVEGLWVLDFFSYMPP